MVTDVGGGDFFFFFFFFFWETGRVHVCVILDSLSLHGNAVARGAKQLKVCQVGAPARARSQLD